jgi:hypothetical protein
MSTHESICQNCVKLHGKSYIDTQDELGNLEGMNDLGALPFTFFVNKCPVSDTVFDANDVNTIALYPTIKYVTNIPENCPYALEHLLLNGGK